MTNELEPLKECPFCGGEDGKHSEDCYIIMSQENVSFINLHHKPMYTSKELREAYNTRYKRTCKMPMYHGEDADDDLPAYYRNFKCDACDDMHSRYKNDDYEFCPHCGAEVVDG